MRPRELVLSGFRSYEAEARFCWDDRSLVGIVGPIGSGKSTILDAIAFALYNQTPRSGNKTTTLINQRRDVAQVSFSFEVAGTTYKAVRSLRRKGASAHAFYRIQDDEDVLLDGMAGPMQRRIEELLGLDFSAFQRSVLLAQNQFAAFLDAGGSERNTVLKGVFGFDRLDAMRAVAKDRLDALGNRLAVLTDRRSTAESDRKDLDARRVDLEAAEQRAAAIEGLRKPFEESKETIGASRRRLEAATAALERIDGLSSRIPDREAAEALLAGAGDAGEKVTSAERALTDATAERTAAVAALDALLEEVGGRAGLDRAADRVASWRSAVERRDAAIADVARAEERVAVVTERATSATEALAAAEQAAAAATEAEATAIDAVEQADASVQAARQAHRAHAVRADLVVGEPCPVCDQPVAVVPDLATPESIETADQTLGKARTTRADASVVAREATDRLSRARADAGAATDAIAEAEQALQGSVAARDGATARVDEAMVAVGEVLGEGDPAESLEAVRSRAAATQRDVDAATAAEASARRALDEARAAARGADTALGDLRADLAALSGFLEAGVTVGDDREAVADALRVLRTEWIDRRAAAAAEVVTAQETLDVAGAALAELLDAAGLGAADDLAEVVAAAVAERSAKEAEVALLEKRLADLDALATDEGDLVAQSALLERIRSDLSPGRFLDYVLDERRRVLGDLASEHFEVLSAGRYRFDDSGEFEVVDLTAADAIRASASLSGGETFLASLALALALAEIVSREGGRLDAFFLDEGFGSLDPEHLDLAMSGVERLVTTGPDRLVVVVSHVPALNERIEDLIVLDRDPVTGDTRVVSGSGCG